MYIYIYIYVRIHIYVYVMIGMHVWIEGADYFYDGSRTELVAAVVNNRI